MIGTLDKNHKVEIRQKVTIVRLNGYACTMYTILSNHMHTKLEIPC